jgi:bacillithiol biosynthesis cysteine-adding enzyme BshC
LNVIQIDRETSHHWNPLMTDYLTGEKKLKPFYGDFPNQSQLKKTLPSRNIPDDARAVLVDSMGKRYEEYGLLNIGTEVWLKILSNPDTRTVTTGHQLCLFGGPAYFVYKIAATIKLARQLSTEKHPVVPIFWLASEDHDFEEVNHFKLGDRAYRWNRDSGGPTGRMSTEGLEEVCKQLKEGLGNMPNSDYLVKLFEDSYLNSKNLSEATFKLVHAIFEGQEILCIEPDDPALKRLFIPQIRMELSEHQSKAEVMKMTTQLEEMGFKGQMHPREINLFYLTDEVRTRIVLEGDNYSTVEGNWAWTREEILKEVEEHPERFSPNAGMRPVYQEVILPNVAYVGGGGELAYWLQLKGIFDHMEIPFPVLFPRNSALVIPEACSRKMEQIGMEDDGIFRPFEDHLDRLLKMNQAFDGFEEEHMMFEGLKEKVRNRFTKAEKGMEEYAGANMRKMEKVLEQLEKKFKRMMKQKEEINIQKLEFLYDQMCPKGVLQERVQNFAYGRMAIGSDFVPLLIEHFDPFQFNLVIFKAE